MRKSTEKRMKGVGREFGFRTLDLWNRSVVAWKENGEQGPQPARPKVDRTIYKEWHSIYSVRYARSTALHEAGHSVIATILFPNIVKEVRVGADRVVLSDRQRTVLGGPEANHFTDGQVIYVQEEFEFDDTNLLNELANRLVIKLAGLASQSIEAFEAPDIDITTQTEELLIAAVLNQFNEIELPEQNRRAVRAQAEQLLASLLSSEVVRKSITEVADALRSAGSIPGSTVTQIVERNCPVDFLERARSRATTDVMNALGKGSDSRNATKERD